MSVNEAVPETGLARFTYEMREGTRKQASVVFALMFRELKTRSKDDDYGLLSLIGIALEPAVYVFAMATFWYFLRQTDILGVHVFLFVAVSLTSYSIVRRSMASVPKAMRTSKAFYSYPNVKPIDAVLARFIIELALVIFGGSLVFFFGWWFLDLAISTTYLLHALGIFSMLMLASFGISLFLAVYGMQFPFILKMMAPVTRLLFFTSAVIHPVAEMPPQAQWFLGLNPLAHAMELLRHYALDMPCFPAASFAYFSGFCIISLFMGLIAYYANRAKVIER